MKTAGKRVLPWTVVVAAALALNGAALWGLQKALAWRAAQATPGAVIQVVVSGTTAARQRQTAAAPAQPAAGVPPATRPAKPGTDSKPAGKTVAALTPTPARLVPDPLPASPAPPARPAARVAETGASAADDSGSSAPGPSAATAAGGAVAAGAMMGPVGPSASAQGAVVLPSANAAYLSNPAPDYPPMSRLRRESGTVLVRVLIGVDGRAHAARLEKSSGYARLDDAALTTARDRWRYRPGTRGGVPEAMWFDVPIQFVLE